MTNHTTIAILLSFCLLATPVYAEGIKEADKFSYAIGFQIGSNLKQQDIKPNVKVLMQAIEDVLAGNKPALTMQEMQKAVSQAQKDQLAKRDERGKKAIEDGKKFLATNKKKKGVTELKSGLQYEVIKKGKGPVPKASDTVLAHYKGTLINGKEFDSSYKRGEPATFGVSQVIKGWQEVLTLMPTGSHWKVYIPSDLAYGPRGAGPNIGPNEALIFDIELIEIKSSSPQDKK